MMLSVFFDGYMEAKGADDNPLSAGRGGDLIFSDSTFLGPGVSEQ